MELEKIRIIQDYSEKIDDDLTIYLNQTREENENFSKNISEDILEEVYMLKSVNIPKNDPRLKQKIIEEVNKIIDQYGYIVHYNKQNQDKQLTSIHEGMSIKDVEKIKFEAIDVDKELETIRTNIINRIITYFNFENQSNSMYWEKSSLVEEIVKKEITLDKLEYIGQKIEAIYLEVLERMKKQQEQFIEEFSYEPNEKEPIK